MPLVALQTAKWCHYCFTVPLPLTKTLRVAPRDLSTTGDSHGSHKAVSGRNFVRSQGSGQDLKISSLILSMLQSGWRSYPAILRPPLRQNRQLNSREGEPRHSYARMAINDGLDFFRMNLQTSDIDNVVPSAEEVVAISASTTMSPVSTKPSSATSGGTSAPT